MDYIFNIGDEVITSDGRRGTITKICDCDLCKARGFFEPIVLFEDEFFPLWITDTEANNGFPSFYKIGEYYFGNIDDTEPLKERTKELADELCETRRRLVSIQWLMYDKRQREKQDGQRTDD